MLKLSHLFRHFSQKPHTPTTVSPKTPLRAPKAPHPRSTAHFLLPLALFALIFAPLLVPTPVHADCVDDGSGNYTDSATGDPCTPEDTSSGGTTTNVNDGCPEGYVKSNILGDTKDAEGNPFTDSSGKPVRCAQTGNAGQGIFNILAIVLNVLTFGVGILATVGIAFSGFQYLTARDNDAVVAKAKMRIFEIVIGLVVYALLWSLLRFILPGGIWGNQI